MAKIEGFVKHFVQLFWTWQLLAYESAIVNETGYLSGAISGGRSSLRCPQAVFGLSPIFKINSPPATSSAWVNQDRVRGLPLRVADWTYMFCGELFSAMMVKFRPRW